MGATSNKPKKGAAKVRHLGRRKAQIARYYEKVYPGRKIRHLLDNNTVGEAKGWAMRHGQIGLFGQLLRQRGLEDGHAA